MATENEPSTSDGTEETRPSKKTGMSTRRKYAIAAGSAAIFATGVVLGVGATHYASGIPSAAAAAKSPSHLPAADSSKQADRGASEWNPFQELRGMRRQMDRMFDDMTTHFRQEPRLGGFADDSDYSLSLQLKDVKDHYEVHARLPDVKATDVKVSLLDDQTLKVQVTDKTTESEKTNGTNAASDITEWGQYEQIIELPGPVKSKHMEVDQAKHELLVTLPKA